MRKIIHRYTVLLLTVLLVGTGIALADTDVVVLGDVNSDGSVNTDDVTALVNYLHGSGTVNLTAADANKDGAVDIADVTAINNIITSGTSDKGTTSKLFFPATTVEKTYGDATFKNQLVRSGSTGAITYESSAEGVATVNTTTGEVTIQGAGTATITATLAGNGGISGTTASYTLNVAQATNSLTTTPVLASTSQDFTGSPVTLVTTEGAALFGSVEYSTTSATEGFSTTVPTATNAGDYTVWYRVPGTASYTAIDAVELGTVTISAATISSVTIADLTAPVKGETLDTEASCSTAGIASVSAVTWMIGGEAASGTAVANKVYTASVTLTANSNYAFAETPTANEVSGKTAVVTRTDDTHITVNYTFDATAKSDLALTLSLEGWTYGAAANTTPTLTGNDGGGSVTYQYKLASAGDGDYTTFDADHYPASAGDYTLKASVAANGDYNGGETTAAFTISKKPLTVTAEAKSRDYGTENPALTYTHGDLATGDNESVFSGALACVATTESSVGTYDITQGTLSAGDNYQIAFTGAVLTVNKATPTLTTLPAAVDGDLTYNGETKQVFTTGTIPDGTGTLKYKVTTDDTRPTSTEEFTTTIPSQTNAGTYYLWYYIDNSGVVDYYNATEINTTPISKAITQATNSFTAQPTITGWTYGADANAPTGAVVQFGTPTYKYSASADGEYGTYDAVVNGNAGTWYVKGFVEGTTNYTAATSDAVSFTISKADITPSVTMSGWTYGEEASSPSVTGNTGNGSVTYQYKVSGADDGTYSGTAPTTPGTYTVKATVAETTNYNGNSATVDFTIASGTLTVTANDYSGTYDGVAHGITVTCEGATIKYRTTAEGEYSETNPTYTNVCDAQTVYYQVTKENYTTVEGSKTVTITQKALTITANAQTISYGSSIAFGTEQVTADGLVDGDALTAVTLTPSTDQVTTSGTITPSAATTTKGIGNYSVTYTAGNLTVNKVAATVTTAPAAVTGDLTYTGGALTLFNAGSVTGGTLKYKVTTSSTKPGNTDGFTTTIGQQTDAGTYYLWYYVEGDANHNSTSVNGTGISKSINKANGAATLSSSSVEFGTTTSNKIVTVSDNTGTVSASVPSGSGCEVSVSENTITITRTSSSPITATITVTIAESTNNNSTTKTINVSGSEVVFANMSTATTDDIGKVICSNGHIHSNVSDVTCGGSASAMIAYVGNQNNANGNGAYSSTYNHGLAIALADVINTSGDLQTAASHYKELTWRDAFTACGKFKGSKPSGVTWMLPSAYQWMRMFKGCGSTASYVDYNSQSFDKFSYGNFRTKLTNCGNNSQGVYDVQSDYYWSGEEVTNSANGAWFYGFRYSYFTSGGNFYSYYVRACYAF